MEEKLSFQAEVSRLLDIVAHALYSQKEVFLRELISNAADACDKLRYLAISQPELKSDPAPFAIRLIAHKEARTLCVSDNGIGMNRDDLVGLLGTIAKSGTKEFMQQVSDKSDASNLIGQFGVGFYAAFMVADKVEVLTRKAGDSGGWRWLSDGKGDYSIMPIEKAKTGTDIILHLKESEDEYLDEVRLRHVVRSYSDHIQIPIYFGSNLDQAINKASALWMRPKSELSDEDYQQFYTSSSQIFGNPATWFHWRAEGLMEYAALLYVPAQRPFDLFDPRRLNRVRLYVKRVSITDQCDGLIPSWLRFLRGVVDSDDLPLNISREMLQHNPMLTKIRQSLTKRILSELEKWSADSVAYLPFIENFGAVLKEGLYEDLDYKDQILNLCRFHSSTADGLISLADYLARMPEGQDKIYYLTGEDVGALRRSPHLEGFAARGIEVLLLNDAIDEFWLPAVGAYQGKDFVSITRGDAGLDKFAPKNTDATAPAAAPVDDSLLVKIKNHLGDAVKEVRASARLTSSLCCLVADSGDMDIHLERLLRQHKQLDKASQRVLEVNPNHPVMQALGKLQDDARLGEVAELMLAEARIAEGEPLADPQRHAELLNRLLLAVLQQA